MPTKLHDRHHHRHAKHGWSAKSPNIVPKEIQEALRSAMTLESVDPKEFDDLLWIMAQESGGIVDARNQSGSSARGLYQLLSAQYDLNPHGVKSFGIAIEECQGGIRYIKQRYKNAAFARSFWEKKHWY